MRPSRFCFSYRRRQSIIIFAQYCRLQGHPRGLDTRRIAKAVMSSDCGAPFANDRTAFVTAFTMALVGRPAVARRIVSSLSSMNSSSFLFAASVTPSV
jgi:hypothetical protein